MKQTIEEANQILDNLMQSAPADTRFFGISKPLQTETLRQISPQSKLINVLQLASDQKWVEIMSMVPAVVDQTLLMWIDRNAAIARSRGDTDAVRRFQRMADLAMGFIEL